jgi:hypothetical protein
VVIATVIATTP